MTNKTIKQRYKLCLNKPTLIDFFIIMMENNNIKAQNTSFGMLNSDF